MTVNKAKLADEQNRESRAKQVAYLVSQGKSQSQIRKMLRLSSQTEVSRLLKVAKAERWIEEWHLCLADAEIAKIEKYIFEKREKLIKKLEFAAYQNEDRPPPENVLVVHTSDDEKKRLAQFGRRAAEYVDQLLKGSHVETCAVAWGRTLKSMIDALGQRNVAPQPTLRFLPVCGEPLTGHQSGFSPTSAAMELAEVFRCKQYLSLAGVPARIPKDFADKRKQADIIKNFVSMYRDYKKIFRSNSPMIDSVDMIVTGIGDVATSEGDHWFKETAELEGKEPSDLKEITAGNIGGVWLPRDPENDIHVKAIDEINRRWLGIQEEHFVKCAKRAKTDPKKSGVVVLAHDARKAPIVERVMGMVNHLIIHEDLAEAILKLSPRR